MAADPDGAERLLLTDGRGSLIQLEDSGQPQLGEAAPRLVLLDWVSSDLLVGVGPEGVVHMSRDGGESWHERGSLPDPPHAFTAIEARWYAATESGILASTDEGKDLKRGDLQVSGMPSRRCSMSTFSWARRHARAVMWTGGSMMVCSECAR